MRKTLLLLTIFFTALSAFKTEKAAAQVTGNTVVANDSPGLYCSVPKSMSLGIYGNMTGTFTPTAADTVTIYINWDDGYDTTFLQAITVSGTAAYYSVYAYHLYTMPGTYTPYVTSTAFGGIVGSNVSSPFTLADSCANLQGVLFLDTNGNCIKDPGELSLPLTSVLIINTTTGDTTYGYTDFYGAYAVNILPGNYNIVTDYYVPWYGGYDPEIAPECPASGTFSFTATSSTSYTQNFAYACAPIDTFDMFATGFNCEQVKGDTSYLVIYAGDVWAWYDVLGCLSISNTVTLTLDPHLHYAGYLPLYGGYAPSSVSGSTITWDVAYPADHYPFEQLVYVYCDTFATIGDTLCNTLYASPTALTDPDLANNTITFCSPVLASFDPNGIAVSPQGTGTPGYILNKTDLTYNIHFQNTGTAPAANITVNDTLSPNVDMSSLHILKSTAPVELYKSGNAVKFRFNNINLADSASSRDSSVGSVTFAVQPKQGLAPGTQIFNKASIYFDYNPAVVTNTVLNTISTTLGVQTLPNPTMKATVYPNPAGDAVYAATDDKSDFTMTLMDMRGRTIATNKSSNGSASVNTQNLPTGLYLVTLTNSAGKQLTTKVTIQH